MRIFSKGEKTSFEKEGEDMKGNKELLDRNFHHLQMRVL